MRLIDLKTTDAEWLRGTNPLVRLALHKDRRVTVGQTLEGTLSRREVRRYCKEHAQGVIADASR